MEKLTAMAMAPPLPHPIFSSIQSIRWPLRDPTKSMPPMHYLRMEELTELRTKSATESLSSHIWMNNVPKTITTLFDNNDDNKQQSQLQYDYTILSLSILLLGHNYTDEAHALVTPYSWPEEIYTSYGPVRYSTSDPGVVSMATYIHSLVHRKEGWNVGEFGMTGWANANYWANAWSRSFLQQEDLQKLWKEPIGDIHNALKNLASSNPAGKVWCEEHLPEVTTSWDPRVFHRLCAQVTESNGENVSEDLVDFAEKAVGAELHALLSHCGKLAGYSSSCSADE